MPSPHSHAFSQFTPYTFVEGKGESAGVSIRVRNRGEEKEEWDLYESEIEGEG